MTNKVSVIIPRKNQKIKRPQKENVLELPVPPLKEVNPISSSLENEQEIIIDLYKDDLDVFLI
tara:strand:+ start:1216 stop:1404 length:189 start_codon:yes stop_codon:yes gene_type:complete